MSEKTTEKEEVDKGIQTTGISGLDNIINSVLVYGKSLSLAVGIVIGLVSGQSFSIGEYLSPALDELYVTKIEFQEFKDSLDKQLCPVPISKPELKPKLQPQQIPLRKKDTSPKINYSFKQK